MTKLTLWDLKQGVEYAAFDGDRQLSKTYRLNSNGELENKDGLGSYHGCDWVPVKDSIRFVDVKELQTTEGVKMETKKTKTKLPKVADLQAGNLLTMQEGVVYVADSGPLAGVRVTRVGGTIKRVRNMLGKDVAETKVDLATTFKPVGKITLETATV